MEDRGSPIFLWTGVNQNISFTPFVGADQRICISVPIGWSLRSDPDEGVVLCNVFKTNITAYTAHRWAGTEQGGFLIRWWENWTSSEYSELPYHNFGEDPEIDTDPEFEDAINDIVEWWNDEEGKRLRGAYI